ncbi:MAG: glycine-rich domain-containing protein, partial [Acidimicrobiales bacterium]
PRYMFVRNRSLGVRYGSAYGLAHNPQINNQLDWNPDGQNFSAVYASHDGTNGYVTTGGTANGLVPATMSIWVRKPSECTEAPQTNGARRFVKFARIGTCIWTPPVGVTSADVLVVAGGGGAGDGGGGAGGVLSSTDVAVNGAVSVTVGQGGAGSRFHNVRQTDNGRPSKFGATSATGGGGGAQYSGSTFGASGGSGGGASADYTNLANRSTGVPGQGNGGGVSCAGGYGGPGGGGGAGAPGQNGGPTAGENNQCNGANTGSNPTRGGNGGAGIQSNITGSNEWYGGGGGGGVNTNGGNASGGSQGGQGGGGTGAWCANCTGGNATDNTGGGGGGGDAEGRGGDGGNGVVIVSYVQPVATTTTTSTSTTSTTTIAVTPTTVRSGATTTVAPALDIVVNAPATSTAPSGASPPATVAVPVVSAPSATTTPLRSAAITTTSGAPTTTLPNNAGGTVAPRPPSAPQVAAGSAAVKVGNETKDATVERSDNQLVVSAGPLRAVVGGVNADGTPMPLDQAGNVRLRTGDTVRIRLAGFKPDSIMEAWLFSTPMLLGTTKVGEDGTVTGTFTIPRDVPSGAHRVVIVARTTDGKPATLAVGIDVGEWEKESTLTIWLLVLPLLLAILGALLLPATRRRRNNVT